MVIGVINQLSYVGGTIFSRRKLPLSKGKWHHFQADSPGSQVPACFFFSSPRATAFCCCAIILGREANQHRPPQDVVGKASPAELTWPDFSWNQCLLRWFTSWTGEKYTGLRENQQEISKHVWQNHAKSMSFCRLSHNKPSSSHPCHCQSGCCAIISCCFCLMDCSWHPGKYPCVRKSPCYLAGSFSPKATLGHSPKVRLIEIHHGTRPANIVGCTDRSRTSRELGSEWLWGVLGISSRSPWFGIWYTDSQLTDRNMSNHM